MPVEVRHLVIKAPNQEMAQLFLERMLAIHHSKNER
jgi:hypothetical protein